MAIKRIISEIKKYWNYLRTRRFAPLYAFFAILLFLAIWTVYVPRDFFYKQPEVFKAEKGMGDDEIGVELERLGIISNNWIFSFYVIITGNHSSLQAGNYNLSPNMSIAQIVSKMVRGDVIKQKLTILEGWDARDIGKYLEAKKFCTQAELLKAAQKDFSSDFLFLKGEPEEIGVEGFIFPDTYEISGTDGAEDFVKGTLANFDKKLNPELRQEIAKQKKSIFEIVTMASIIEKEVRTLEEKKIVSGILWKRMNIGMPLQVDSTINYITNGNDPSVTIKDTKIDSPYNTYKYPGLPLGPISSPGMDSIMAAIYPQKTSYLYYLSSPTGKTIFSKTLTEHNAAIAKYLK